MHCVFKAVLKFNKIKKKPTEKRHVQQISYRQGIEERCQYLILCQLPLRKKFTFHSFLEISF